LDNANVGKPINIVLICYQGTAAAVPFLLGGVFVVKVNGKMISVSGKNIAELLEQINCISGRVAVELNEEIVPKNAYEKTILKDGDSVEVVRFVGGG